MRWDSFKINRWIPASNSYIVISSVHSQSQPQPTDVSIYSAYAIIGIRL